LFQYLPARFIFTGKAGCWLLVKAGCQLPVAGCQLSQRRHSGENRNLPNNASRYGILTFVRMTVLAQPATGNRQPATGNWL
jgi:hypothetical protein